MFGLFKTKKRQAASGYTSRILEANYNIATGTEQINTIHSALVACANLVDRSILASTVTGSDVINHVTASRMARELMLTGEALRLIDVRDGVISLLEVSDWTISSGAGEVSPSQWNYKLTIPAPGGSITRNVTSGAVIHIRLHVDPLQPWKGRNPLAACPAFQDASRRLERYLSVELKSPIGKIVPVPQNAADYETADGKVESPLQKLKEGLQNLNGSIATPETMMNSGDGRSGAPARDWVPQALGPVFPASLPNVLESTRESVYAACGVPNALWSAGAASTREAFRVFLSNCLKPLAFLMSEEIGKKLEATIEFDFGSLAASDITAKARATKGLVDAGVELQQALQLAGLNQTEQ